MSFCLCAVSTSQSLLLTLLHLFFYHLDREMAMAPLIFHTLPLKRYPPFFYSREMSRSHRCLLENNIFRRYPYNNIFCAHTAKRFSQKKTRVIFSSLSWVPNIMMFLMAHSLNIIINSIVFYNIRVDLEVDDLLPNMPPPTHRWEVIWCYLCNRLPLKTP